MPDHRLNAGETRAGLRHSVFAPRFCVVTATLLVASGCAMVGPDYETPDADTASSWLDEDDARVERTAADHRDWWNVGFPVK